MLVFQQAVKVGAAGYEIDRLVFTPPVTYKPTGTTQTIDWSLSNYFVLDLAVASGNVTLTYINAAAGAQIVIEVFQSSVGAIGVTLPAGTICPGGTPYSATTTMDAIDKLVVSTKNGTTFFTDFAKGYA